MKILITGTAGFIGFHLAKKLLEEGNTVVGIDNINNYYDVNLKYARLAESGIYSPNETRFKGGENRSYPEIPFHQKISSKKYPNYHFYRMNLEDENEINELFRQNRFQCVVNLAAQAGVRYSIENPKAYINSNIVGFLNILEACRHYPVEHLVYASSSSVYGKNAKIPFSVNDKADAPVSLYAATKKSNELMAYTYSHLYNIKTTGLRFFTVYGSWGRPDMAPILFAKAISKGEAIKVFNKGNMERDFTHISDIVESMVRLIGSQPSPLNILQTSNLTGQAANSMQPSACSHQHIYNIGNGKPVNLLTFIETIEKAMGKSAKKEMYPMQPGDVHKTWADTRVLEKAIGYKPFTEIKSGIDEFAAWFKKYYESQ